MASDQKTLCEPRGKQSFVFCVLFIYIYLYSSIYIDVMNIRSIVIQVLLSFYLQGVLQGQTHKAGISIPQNFESRRRPFTIFKALSLHPGGACWIERSCFSLFHILPGH